MSNLFMQVPIATTSAKSFATPLSPPLSPNLFELSSASSSSFMSIPENEESHHYEPPTKSKLKNKYRMRICDAPPELLETIKKSLPNKSSSIINVPNVVKSEEKNGKPLPNKSPSITNVSTSANSNDQKILKRCRIRKNPYPKKAPSRSSPGITLQVDVYSTFKKDPKALLKHSTSSSNSSLLFIDSESESDAKSSLPQSTISQRSSIKGKRKIKTTTNSLARVLADHGLIESTSTPTVTAAKVKLIRIPPPPIMQFDELMRSIEQFNLDSTMLHQETPEIHWKSFPMPISHLPHNGFLHTKEAHVASTIRITPLQYLTAKYILISSARRYAQKSLPFRKCDAQKLLRIDVNKAIGVKT